MINYIKLCENWKLPSQSKLTPIEFNIFNMELTLLGSEASNYNGLFNIRNSIFETLLWNSASKVK